MLSDSVVEDGSHYLRYQIVMIDSLYNRKKLSDKYFRNNNISLMQKEINTFSSNGTENDCITQWMK